MLWLKVGATTQHSNSALQVEKPRTAETTQGVNLLALLPSLIPGPHMVQREELPNGLHRQVTAQVWACIQVNEYEIKVEKFKEL